MAKQQPEFDLFFKYAKQFVDKKLDEVAKKLEDVIDTPPAPEKKTAYPDVPQSVKTRIDTVLSKHEVFESQGTMRVCVCGVRSNALGYRNHVRDEIIAALTATDPTEAWWKSVTDRVR